VGEATLRLALAKWHLPNWCSKEPDVTVRTRATSVGHARAPDQRERLAALGSALAEAMTAKTPDCDRANADPVRRPIYLRGGFRHGTMWSTDQSTIVFRPSAVSRTPTEVYVRTDPEEEVIVHGLTHVVFVYDPTAVSKMTANDF
jgi:hypothetical protein